LNATNNTILSLLILGILIIPIVSMDYVEDRKVEKILELGDENYQQLQLENTLIDVDSVERHYNSIGSTFIGDSNNSDMISVHERSGNNRDVEYLNNSFTYLGNGTYNVDLTSVTYNGVGDYVLIPLNMTTKNLTNYDYVTIEYSGILQVFSSEFGDNEIHALLTGYSIETNKAIYIIDLGDKSLLNVLYDNPFYLRFSIPTPTTDFDYKITLAEPVNETAFELNDMTYYYIILTGTIAISIFALIFVTNTIDIIFDYKDNKKNKWKK